MGRLPKDMQPIAEGQFRNIAQLRIEPRQRLRHLHLVGHATRRRQPCSLGPGADLARHKRCPPRIHHLRLRKLLDQIAQQRGFSARAELRQLGREMAERDCREPSLGRSGLAGIIDDIGIDDRQTSRDDAGPAGPRQRHRLARQPFRRAMRAKMDQRVAAGAAQGEIEGEIAMAGRHVGVVIARLAVAAVTRWLQRHHQLAEVQRPEAEAAIAERRIGLGRAMAFEEARREQLRAAPRASRDRLRAAPSTPTAR